LLLKEAIRELVIPRHLHALTERLEDGPVNMQWLAGVRHTVLMSIVMQVYRLKETREHFLCPWLFADVELRRLGLLPLEEFIGHGKWRYFEIVRHQYAGHATSREAERGRPGRVLPASVLGNAFREAGLVNSIMFLDRVVAELAPAVENVLAELRQRYPDVDTFVKMTYPTELEQAMNAQR
jgi:hypothetical protein